MPTVVLLALTLALLALQDKPVTGAKLFIVERTVPRLNVTIENRRDSPLVEWQVTAGNALSGGRAAVVPHGQHVITFSLEGQPTPGAAKVVVARYADGIYEGSGPVFETWLKARRDHADDLGFWVKALMEMPRVSLVSLRTYLTDKLAERSVHDRPNVEHVSDRVRTILRRHGDGPEVWPPLDELKQQIEQEFIEASRQSGVTGRSTEVTGTVIVSSQETTATRYIAVVENLRDLPIEALRFDELGSDGRARGSLATDYCQSDPGDRTSGHGRIQPRERREFQVFPQPDRPLGSYALSFVLYDDLSFEGSVQARDDALRRRDEQAEEYAFAIATLKEAAAIPAGDVEAFLLRRKTEWARQVEQRNRYPSGGGPLEEALRQVRGSPARFLAGLDSYRDSLEQQLARLRRHLPPHRN